MVEFVAKRVFFGKQRHTTQNFLPFLFAICRINDFQMPGCLTGYGWKKKLKGENF